MSTTETHRSAERRLDVLADRQLERQGRRLGHSAVWFLVFCLVLVVPGIVLVAVGSSWPVIGLGAALVLLASLPGAVAVALLGSSAVARWSARRKPFA
jgi:hypothetical protein